MMEEEDLTDRVYRYLEGGMSDTEAKAFEKELETNGELREELEFCRTMFEAEIRANQKALAQNSEREKYLDAIREISGKNLPDWRNRVLFIAVILLLLTAGGWLVWRISGPAPEKPTLTPLVFGEETAGTIANAAEMDSYTFSATEGETLVIRLRGAGFDPSAELYLPDNRVSLPGRMEEDSASVFRVVLPISGEYTLRISGRGGRTGNYLLRADSVTPATADDGPETSNDSESVQVPVAPIPEERMAALSQKQLNHYFSADFSDGQTMGQNEPEDQDTLALASRAFERRDWENAIGLYEKVGDLHEYSKDYARLGVAYLQAGRTDSAVSVFRRLSETSLLPEWRNRARWYLLLSYLAGGEKYRKQFESAMDAALRDSEMDEGMKERLRGLNAAYKKLLN